MAAIGCMNMFEPRGFYFRTQAIYLSHNLSRSRALMHSSTSLWQSLGLALSSILSKGRISMKDAAEIIKALARRRVEGITSYQIRWKYQTRQRNHAEAKIQVFAAVLGCCKFLIFLNDNINQETDASLTIREAGNRAKTCFWAGHSCFWATCAICSEVFGRQLSLLMPLRVFDMLVHQLVVQKNIISCGILWQLLLCRHGKRKKKERIWGRSVLAQVNTCPLNSSNWTPAEHQREPRLQKFSHLKRICLNVPIAHWSLHSGARLQRHKCPWQGSHLKNKANIRLRSECGLIRSSMP